MDHHRRKQQQQHHRAGGAEWKGRSHPGGGGGGKGRSSFWGTLAVVLCCVLLSALTFSTFRLFGVSFRPVLVTTWQQAPALHAISAASGGTPNLLSSLRHPSSRLLLHHAVAFPDQLLFFLRRPSQPSSLATSVAAAATTTANDDVSATSGQFALLRCLYFTPSSGRPSLLVPPVSVDHSEGIVWCPLQPYGFLVSLGDVSGGNGGEILMPPVRPRQWDALAYESLLDARDNSTIVFVKGLNLRPERLSDASRYECVFGWDFARPRYLLTSDALSVAQEIVRCRTPLSVLRRHSERHQLQQRPQLPVMVSVKAKGRGTHIMPSVARPVPIPRGSWKRKKYRMCVCTMVRNQARFLNEWITYHAHIGVERWFIYDNNSNDSLEHTVRGMEDYNVTRHVWPWVKTQEAGFAHCALRARASCEWVGFIDVDEFLYLPSPELSLNDVLKNYTTGYSWVAELRTQCHTFGPSGHKAPPPEGVLTGYTCRMAAPERHKSIVRPEALSSSLINVVHHFHLRDGFRYVNVDRAVMVINHYKYQAWEVFKEKFYRRVATYVADWRDKENEGSKDRAPGLGTKPVEPLDWSNRFCEVKDTGLRDRVVRIFGDPGTGRLPW